MNGTRPGPAVVALGGGHGLAVTLRAALAYAGSVTAVVSVADDGGSSGRLRAALDIPAPGDLRKCLVALGDADGVWGRAFEHRFEGGELSGHAVGNLVLAGLIAATGDVVEALDEAARLVGARGRVLPATVTPVVLTADGADGAVHGQVRISTVGHVTRVALDPPDAAPPAAVLDAIAAADQVVVGPGSLYTSILAVVAVPAVRDALARTSARKVYVANLREQRPETAGYDVGDHVDALAAHGLDVDVVVRDVGGLPCGHVEMPTVEADLTGGDPARPGVGHDPVRLAAELARLVG